MNYQINKWRFNYLYYYRYSCLIISSIFVTEKCQIKYMITDKCLLWANSNFFLVYSNVLYYWVGRQCTTTATNYNIIQYVYYNLLVKCRIF